MTGWSSTTIRLVTEHCPAALDFYESGTPYDREIFQVGLAAHDVLESLGKASAARGTFLGPEESEQVAREACERLIREGREFYGVKEPPVPAVKVWEGRDLALAYQIDNPLAPDFRYEETVAVTRDWLPCPPKGAWLRARIDAVGTRLPDWFEDDGGGPALLVRDYKSAYSAWEAELRTLQRKIQAVLSWLHWGEGHEELRLAVVNFRTKKDHELSIFPNTPEGARVMERWKQDIASEIAELERTEGHRPAIAGSGCLGCPYLGQCATAQSYLTPIFGSADPEELARSYAAVTAIRESLDKPVRRAAERFGGSIPVHGGAVGFVAARQRLLTDTAPDFLAEYYLSKARPSTLEAALALFPGFLRSLRPGVANAENLLKALFKGKDDPVAKREALLSQITTVRPRVEFGVHKNKKEEEPHAEG